MTAVRQIGTDRIIDIIFSEGAFHLFLEFFAGGNVILTDGDLTILAVLRHVPAGGDQEEVKVGLKYTVTNKQNYNGVPELSPERLRQALQNVAAAEGDQQQQTEGGDGSGATAKQGKKKKRKPGEALRKALSAGFPEFPPLLLEHALTVAGVDLSSVTPEQALSEDNAPLFEQLMAALQEAKKVSDAVESADTRKGYIVAKEDARRRPAETTDADGQQQPPLLYDDFHPFRPRQFENQDEYHILEFDSFNKTVDEYFSSLEAQKLESRLAEHEETARKRLENARLDHQQRVGALKEAQEMHIRKANAIEANVYRVQEAIDAVNGLVAQGMDWVEIERLIEMEQGRNNPVAQIIKLPLKLHENTITLRLSEATYDDEASSESESEQESDKEEDESEGRQRRGSLSVDIDLGLSPWANATQYYNQKKSAAVKEQKTIQASEKALKAHEKKVTEDLKRHLKKEKQVLRPTRAQMWFEKFRFFVSSDGYLVLSGRDAHQSEILYRRHMKKGDVFVHSDVEGAMPVVVRNHPDTPNAPIPPGTLSQAGSLSVATSKAWDTKALMPAWWVPAHQVSKTNERGELLARVGEFHIKGEKNYLTPSQPVLGFAVLFQITRESVVNHRRHRRNEATESPEHGAASEGETAQEGEGGKEENVNAGGEGKTARKDEGETEETTDKASQGDVKEGNANENQEKSESESESESEGEDDEENTRSNPLQSSTAEQNTSQSDEKREEKEPNEEPAHEEGEPSTQEATTDIVPSTSARERPQGKRYLSAHERRQLKKGRKPTTSSSDQSATPTPPSQPSTPSTTSTKQQPAAQQPRGKMSKAKKAALKKYAEQDEEERELALRLLGVKKPGEKTTEKTPDAAVAKAQKEAELEAQKQRRRAQHDRAAAAERKRQAQLEESGAAAAADETAEDGEGEESGDLSEILPTLVSVPHSADTVVAALPVAAPWSAVSRYKYRAKLQPGTVKKGKAVKEILSHWLQEASVGKSEPGSGGGKIAKKAIAEDMETQGLDRATAERMRAVEGELLRTWRDVEVVNTVPVTKVRIVSAGITSGGGDAPKGGKNKGKGKGKK